MTTIAYAKIEVADTAAAKRFYADAFGLDDRVGFRTSQERSTGFRGFTLSLLVSQPSTVDSLVASALQAGAASLKPVEKSLWGYGGVVQCPDGTIVTVASSQKKDSGRATRKIDDVVLQLGVDDVGNSKRFYVDQGFQVAKSFGWNYVELGAASSPVKLTLYKRRALAKVAGVSENGSGSHRLRMGSNAGAFTDPDGFEWEAASR